MTNELSELVDELPGLTLTTLADGRVDFVNRTWSEYTGLSRSDCMGDGWYAAVHPEDAPFVRERWALLDASRAPSEFELRLRRHDGVFHWFLLQTRPFGSTPGTPAKWCAVAVDINARKRSEKELHTSTFRAMCESIPGLVCTMTPNGDVEVFNRELLEFFGKTSEELRAWGINDLVHPDDREAVVKAFTRSRATA